MHENKRRALAIAVAGFFLPAFSQGDAAPEDGPACCGTGVDGYRNLTRKALARCQRGVRLRPRESVTTEDRAKLRACITAAIHETRLRLAQALPEVPQPPARMALRAYQAIYESAVAGVEPTRDEPVAAYEQRQSSLRHAMAHAWARFEVAER
jgi:hypothetical protein